MSDTARYQVRALGRQATNDLIRGLSSPIGGLFGWDGDLACMNCAYALGELRITQSVDYLVQLLKDPNPDVRASAAWALGEIRVERAIPRLRSMLGWMQPPVVRSFCAEALGKLRAREAADDLIYLLDDRNVDVRARAIQALGRIGHRDALRKIIPFLGDFTPCNAGVLSSLATGALVRLGVSDLVISYYGALYGDDSSAERLVPFRPEIATAFVRGLNQPDLTMAENAARALIVLGSPEDLGSLRTALRERSKLRSVLAEVIHHLEQKHSLPKSVTGEEVRLEDLPRPSEARPAVETLPRQYS